MWTKVDTDRIARESQQSFCICWQNIHCHLANLWNRITTKIFDIFRINTLKQQKFSQSNPVLIRQFKKSAVRSSPGPFSSLQWVQFIAKRRGCCCNMSVGVALKVWFSQAQYMKITKDEHAIGMKSCEISIYWWIWILSFFLFFLWNFFATFGQFWDSRLV